jgi:hypothetical protein
MIQGRAEVSEHIGCDDMAAYIDRTLPGEDRRRVDSHLASCDECRTEAIASQNAVSTAPTGSGSRIRSWSLIGGAVAAAALIIVAGTTITRTRNGRNLERDTNVAAAAVVIASPSDGRSLGPERVVAWHRLAENTSYRVTIANEGGQPIYTTTIRDTSVVIPPFVTLQTGGKYFWYVDAIRADGAIATSGLKSFTIK